MLAASLLAQTKPAAATGSVSGRVVDADTKMPISGIRARAVIRPGPRSGTTATFNSAPTDADGRYVIRDIPAGLVEVLIEDGSLVTTPVVPRNVSVVGGQNIPDIDFHARVLAQISGRVLDGDGNPFSGIQVYARSKEYLDYTGSFGNQSRTDQLSLISRPAAALTDDQGRYVIQNLRAGRQYWIVAENPSRYSNPISDSPADPQARKRTPAATYYPNANSIETGMSIVPRSLELRDNIDIHMFNAPSYCLEATLTAGGVPTNMNFLLHATEEPYKTLVPSANLPGSSVTSGDGKIRLCDLYPGRFELIAAKLGRNEQEFLSATDIVISNNDIHDLIINAMPRSTVAGEFVWDSPATPSSAAAAVTIRTYPSPVSNLGRPPASPAAPGMFSLDVMAGIVYIPVISGLDSHSYVKDISYRGVSILNKLFRPEGSDQKLRITIGSNPGSITAKISGADGPSTGTAVVVLPVTAQTEGEVASTMFAGVTDEMGSYRATGLPPGKYDLFAMKEPPPSVVFGNSGALLIDRTPETIGKIMRARTRGQRVEVGSGSHIQVNLVPITLE
jgi:hypothetical protein